MDSNSKSQQTSSVSSEWSTKVVRRRNNNNTKNRSNGGGNNNKRDTSKKFTGYSKGDLEGIVLTEDGSITQFTDFQDRLQTVGGCQYMPKVGTSIETLKRFVRRDFAPTKPRKDEWTTTDSEGKEHEDEELKETLDDMYKEQLKQSIKDLSAYNHDMAKVYTLALGQIDDGMKEKLKSNDQWDDINTAKCPVKLLKLLRDVCFQGNRTKIHTPTNLVRCLRKLLCSRQRTPDTTSYVQQVVQLSEVLETIGGEYICPAIVKYELEHNKDKYNETKGSTTVPVTYSAYLELSREDKLWKQIHHNAFQQFVAAVIIEGCDEDTSTLKETLGNQYNLGVSQYPSTTTKALEMLNHFKGTKKPKPKQKNNNNNNRGRKNDQNSDDSNQPGSKSDETKESNTFVTKGTENNGDSSKQLLMMAVENDADFGQEMDNFFQLCEVIEKPGNTKNESSHCHVHYSNTNEESETSSDSSTGNSTHYTDYSEEATDSCEQYADVHVELSDDEDNWNYWAARDAEEEEPSSAYGGNKEELDCVTYSNEDELDCVTTSSLRSGDSLTDEVEEEADELTGIVVKTTFQPPDPPQLGKLVQLRDVQDLKSYEGRYGVSVAALDLAYTDSQALRYGVITVFRYSRNVERLLAQTAEGRVNENWILLDSESSCNLITNPKLVKNIWKAPNGRSMNIYCNSGMAYTDEIADLPGYGEVWFYKDGIASVLSLALTSDKYRVTMDTSIDNALYIHRKDGSTRRFGRSSCNLYYYDMSMTEEANMLTIMSVNGNKQQFSDLDCRRAEKARKLQEIMGFPTTKDLIRMIDGKLIANTTVTRRDIQNAEIIYGKHTSIVKGKQVRSTADHTREDVTSVPRDVLNRYKEVTLHVDIMTVNGVRFFHSISRHIRFRTARAITNATEQTLLDCVASLSGQYRTRGFIVTQVFADNQFECIRNDLLKLESPVQLQCVPSGQHEPTVERSIRTMKDNIRCYFNHVPFSRLPRRCIIELVYAVVYWLNCRTTGVCKTLSARELMTGIPLDAKECKFQFMEPVLAHVDDTDNTMRPRAVEALYLRPTGSITGGYWAYDISTGKRIHRRSGTATPLTDAMVKRVEDISRAQSLPVGIIFGNSEGKSTIHDIDTQENLDDDDASDVSYKQHSADDDDESLGTTSDSIEEVNDIGEEPLTADQHTDTTATTTAGDDDDNNSVQDDEHQTEDADEQPDEVEGADGTDEPPVDNEPVSSRLRHTVTRTHNKFNQGDGYEPSTYSRSFFTGGYHRAVSSIAKSHAAVMMVTNAIEHYNNIEASHVTPQYGVKKGIRLFGEAGVNAVLKELQQIHDRKVLSALDPQTMTKEMVQQALPYLMFLKRKRDTSIKGRGCADGRRQRDFIRKEDATSPTVSLYALILSCIIDAIEGRDVATVDIPGAFLQTDMPEGEDVYIRLDGPMAELLCRVDPKMYRKYLLNKNGKKTLFTRAEKAIYGTLRAAILFWEKLFGQLEEWGFEANPYDPCTVNKIIDGKQCTIVWHVDDLKISHKDPKVVKSLIDKLNEKFGVESPLTETRGKIHDYVGMTIDYTAAGKVRLSMFDYLEDIIKGLPESLRGSAITPAADHLFKVNDQSKKLSEQDAALYHHYVAKLLYMSKRTRPDIQTAVAFLCTRIASPDVDDWKKLKRVMGYLAETPFLPLVLGWDGSGNVYWHVDAAFAVHNDMRSHTGGVMTLGTGGAITTCTKQKLNTKSSTEAELVGVDDNMPFILWTRYFLMAQKQHMTDNAGDIDEASGRLMNDNILYQDNESAMKLERNGRASSTKRTKHINVRYFFITDRIKKGEVTVEYCPTDDIVADYFTKPLQGSKFRKFRNTVQGITDADYIRYKQSYMNAQSQRAKAQECTVTPDPAAE